MSATTNARLSWLHLSDLHLREKTGWAQDKVLKSLLEDVSQRYSGQARPDLLFLTGDIAFSGKRAEYSLAADFVQRMCTSTGMTTDRIFIVPGNHDIDRDVSEDAIVGARATLTSPEAVDRFLGNEDRRRVLFARQSEFRAFANGMSALPTELYSPTSYAHSRKLQVGALQIRVLLLDSSWLATGGEADAGSLVVGERQVLDCGEPDPGCLTFALMHHPLSWLLEFEQIPVENLLSRCAHLCLRGHVHAVDMRRSESHAGQILTFTAGAAFMTRASDNSYVWCSLDLTTGCGQRVTHRYSQQQSRWDPGQAESWQLLSGAPKAPNAQDAHGALAATRLPYPAYVTCLACGLQTDVPIALAPGKMAFVSYDASLPKAQNTCGQFVQQLRHHFFWRAVWTPEAWDSRLREITDGLGAALSEFHDDAAAVLSERDATARSLIESFRDGGAATSPVCDEVRQLIADRDLSRARAVLARWLGEEILTSAEKLELGRLNALLFLAEGRPSEAVAQAGELLELAGRSAADLALAARCALDHGDGKGAAELMHEALDAGFSPASARTIAVRIAGLAGDDKLTQRVRT